jgi:hypothetical protein
MRRTPPIVMHIPDGWPPAALAGRISAFHFECIERRIENMDLTPKQRIKVIEGIIRILQHQEQFKPE